MMVSFLMLVFLITFVFMSQRSIETSRQNFDRTVSNFQQLVVEEVKIAYTVEDGYARQFLIPKSIESDNYTMTIEGGIQFSVNVSGKTYSTILPGYVRGGFCMKRDFDPSYYHIMITKDAGIVSLSTCPDCGYSYYMCSNAEVAGWCPVMDAMSPGFITECCDGHCKCCP